MTSYCYEWYHKLRDLIRHTNGCGREQQCYGSLCVVLLVAHEMAIAVKSPNEKWAHRNFTDDWGEHQHPVHPFGKWRMTLVQL